VKGELEGRMRTVRCIVALLALLASCNQVEEARPDNLPEADFQAISAALAKGQIERVEIVQIPARILTRTQITPETLEKNFYNKLIIRNITENAYYSKIVEAFSTTSVQPRTDTADVRWGVIFYSRNGTRLGAVHFEPSGHYGAVNGVPVSFRGEFFHWLDTTFSSSLQ
jgi:hypothetical protein